MLAMTTSATCWRGAIVLFVLHWLASAVSAQTLTAIQGRVLDMSGAVLRDAVVRVWNHSVGFDTSVRTDAEGRSSHRKMACGLVAISALYSATFPATWLGGIGTGSDESVSVSLHVAVGNAGIEKDSGGSMRPSLRDRVPEPAQRPLTCLADADGAPEIGVHRHR